MILGRRKISLAASCELWSHKASGHGLPISHIEGAEGKVQAIYFDNGSMCMQEPSLETPLNKNRVLPK